MKKPTNKAPKKTKPAPSHANKLACLSYLHGDVIDSELEAACGYEFARESEVLIEAARLSASGMDSAEISFKLNERFCCADWFIQHPWGFIWGCPSFPEKSWNQLGDKERAELLLVWPLGAGKVRALPMNEVWLLEAMGIFDRFKAMAAEVKEARKRNAGNPKPVSKVLPLIEGWPKQKLEEAPWVHALFTVDFRKTPERLKDEFSAWLKLPENQKRTAKYKLPPQRADACKDPLKALAAWRLYDAFGGDWQEAVAFADDHRLPFERAQKIGGKSYKFGEPRPFHNPGRTRDESGKKIAGEKAILLNQEPLFCDQAAYLRVIRRAKDFLAELLPWEYGKYAVQSETRQSKFMDEIQAWMKEAKRTSTKSS